MRLRGKTATSEHLNKKTPSCSYMDQNIYSLQDKRTQGIRQRKTTKKEEHSERHCAAVKWKRKKRKKRLPKWTWETEIYIKGEQRKQPQILKREGRGELNKVHIKEVGIWAMWLKRWSRHPPSSVLSCYESSQTTCAPAFQHRPCCWWTKLDRLFLTGVGTDHNHTDCSVFFKIKQESAQQTISCFIVSQRCCCCNTDSHFPPHIEHLVTDGQIVLTGRCVI